MALILSPRQLTHRAQFYQQFAQLTGAGIRVIEALQMIGRGPPARSYRKPIAIMVARLSEGETVAGAMRHLGHWMPAFDLALIQAGEHSGRLDAVCRLLAEYYDDRARMLRQMIADLAYPLFVLHFAIILFPFLAWFSGGSMFGFLAQTIGILVPAYLLVLLFIYAGQGRHGVAWRSFVEQLLRPVPVLGKARHFLALSRLAAALEALINAGVTIIEAWEMAAAACGSPAINRAVLAWKPLVLAGQTPGESVRNCSLFPEMFSNFYNSGEISGQLDDSLRRLHRFYQEEATRRMRFLARWVPQFIYFCVAGFVAYKVISFYTGYFNQINQILP